MFVINFNWGLCFSFCTGHIASFNNSKLLSFTFYNKNFEFLKWVLKESCGFPTKGHRNQVYKLDFLNDYGKYCLSGTSEMALAGFLKNKTFNESELPIK